MVRPLIEGDLDAVVSLMEIVAAERIYIGREPPVDRDLAISGFRDRMSSDKDAALVAQIGEEIVGYVGLRDMRGLVELGMLVAPRQRGRGVGRCLMDATLRWALARSAHKLTLQVWPHNEAAIALYRSYGFQQEGYLHKHWRRANGEVWDALIMGRVLTDEMDPEVHRSGG